MARKLELETLYQTGEVQIGPISIDGSCNVYQHLSALTRDEVVAPLVKTSEGYGIDIYQWFQDLLVKRIEGDDKSPLRVLFQALGGYNMREFVKPVIMTFPYGSTLMLGTTLGLNGHMLNYSPTLRIEHLQRVTNLQVFLRRIVGGAQVVGWVAPDGFAIKQRYYNSKEVTIHTTANGKVMATNLMFTTDVVNRRKHKQAVCANFIHSLDAYHMRQIIRRVSAEGIDVVVSTTRGIPRLGKRLKQY